MTYAPLAPLVAVHPNLHLLRHPYFSLPVPTATVGLEAMSGGTMFEHPNNMHLGHSHGHAHGHHAEGMMSDWASMRQDKELLSDRPMPSPAHSHISAHTHESAASPYPLQSAPNMPSSSNYYHQPPSHHHPAHSYPALPTGMMLSPAPLPPSSASRPTSSQPRYNHQPQYNSSGEYDIFQTPTARGKYEYPQPIIYDHSQMANGIPTGGLLTTSALSRSYDSTIPQYYPVMADRSWSQTPDKAGQKRKRGKGAAGAGATPTAPTPTTVNGKSLKTPRKKQTPAGSPEEGRVQKRTRTGTVTSMTPTSQLPTPPPTSNELPTPTFSVTTVATSVLPDMPTFQMPGNANEGAKASTTGSAGEEAGRRRGLKVTRSEGEGRKLAVGQLADENELVVKEEKPSRSTPVPSLITTETGHVELSTHQILESELAWLENGGRASSSPASSPEPNLVVTPNASDLLHDDEDDVSTEQKAEKVAKRLQAFNLHTTKVEEPMVCTRISSFGRMAVRKDAAQRFLGLDTSAIMVEETKEDEEWVEAPIAGSSKSAIKPSWPDELAPWSIATSSRGKKERENRERATLLKRYLENSADELSDDEEIIYPVPVTGKGKGKSVSQLIRVSAPDASDPRRRVRGPWEHTIADAKAALLTSLRNRPLPAIPSGIVACACGSLAPNLGTMLSCANCKTWHHAVCNGIDENQLSNGRWWCPSCENQVIRINTPSHQTPRHAYIQSEERSSAFKGQIDHIALAPSPMFVSSATFTQPAISVRTPLNRAPTSPTSRNHRSRILSYGTDIWNQFNDENNPMPTPSTPSQEVNRFTTPRIDDAPFDVTSTPSRHLDFGFGQPSLFSLTPLVGRSRIPSHMVNDTPLTYRARMASQTDAAAGGVGGRHDFLRDLAGPTLPPMAKDLSKDLSRDRDGPGSPQSSTRWPHHTLLGAHSISSSGLGHRRSLSGSSKLSSVRQSSRSGLGLGLPLGSRAEETMDEDNVSWDTPFAVLSSQRISS